MDQPKRSPSLDGKYTVECQHEGCTGKKIIDYPMGAGLSLGQFVNKDITDPQKAMCPLCKRFMMKVVSVPTSTAVVKPKGFSRVPTE